MALPKLAGVLAIAVTGSAVAEEAARLEEIVVVSSRVEQSPRDVPAAIGIVDRRDIQLARQQLGLDESLNRIPGVFSQNRYNFAQDLRLAIRGFGARANFGIRGVRIFADGIPSTTADGQSGVDDIDLGTLDRIEVTRGPSSSLYGASSGGVINLFTEDGTDAPYIEGGVTVGEYDHRKYQVKAGGQSGKLNYFLNYSDLTYDGYRDLSKLEARQFYSKLRYDIDDVSDLTLVVSLVDSPEAEDAGAITSTQVDADPTQAQPRNISSNAGEELDQQKIGITYTRSIGEHAMSIRNYYLWRDFEAFLPIGTHIPFVADDGVVEFDRFFYGGGIQFDFATELFGRPNRIITGIDIDMQEDDRQRFLNEAGMKGAMTFDQIEEAKTYGVFVRDELAITDTLTAIVGLRYDSVDLEVDDKYLANADQSGDVDFDEVSPTVGVVWDVTEDVTLYANYASSFETPTFTELASPARNLDVSLGGFNNVTAQEADSIELGIKAALFGDRIYFDAAVFTMDVEDEITSVSNIGNRSFFENADTERSGLELYLVVDLAEGLTLSLAYTYADFEFDDFPTDQASEGNDLPGLPENQLFAELAYNHASGFYVAGDVLYVDELYANNSNSVVNDSSTTANLRAGFQAQLGQWSVAPFVGVNNLFDEEYNANVRINGFGGRLFEPGPETNVYGGITVRYNAR